MLVLIRAIVSATLFIGLVLMRLFVSYEEPTLRRWRPMPVGRDVRGAA